MFSFRAATVYKAVASFEGQETVKVEKIKVKKAANDKMVKKVCANTPLYLWATYGTRTMFSEDILVKVLSDGVLTPKYIIAKHGKCPVNNILANWNPKRHFGKYCDRKQGVAFFVNDYSASPTMDQPNRLPFHTIIGPGDTERCDHLLVIASHGVARWVQAQRSKGGNATGALAGRTSTEL